LSYLSLDLLLILPLLLARDSRNLRQMAFGFALVTCVSHLYLLPLADSDSMARFRPGRNQSSAANGCGG
jgi:hypothetical protein